MPTNILTVFLAALTSALATTLVAVAAEWLKQRGQEARAKRDAGQAAAKLDFLSAWLTLRQRLTEFQPESDRILLSRQLERIRQEADEAWSREGARSPVRAAIARLLILGIGRDDRLMQGARVFYWIILGWLVVVEIPQFVARLLRAPPNEDWAYYFGYVARGVVDNLVLPVSFLIILRWAIGWLITHKSETPAS